MTKFALLLSAACLVLSLSLTAEAQGPVSPSKQVLIERIMEVAHTEEQSGLFFDVLMSSYIDMMPPLEQSSATSFDSAPPALRQEMIKLVNDTTIKIAQRTRDLVLSDGVLKATKRQVAIDYWNNNFSEDELRQALEFFQAPVGQKLIRTAPALATAATQKAKELAGPRINEIFKQVQAEEMDKALVTARELEKKYKSKSAAKPH